MSPGTIDADRNAVWTIRELVCTDAQWDEFSTAQLYMASQRGSTRWLGAELCKLPSDLLAYQEIIYETRPTFIIETGTFCGGSARFLQSMLALLGDGGQVLTIDIGQHPEMATTPGVTYFVGISSVDPQALADAARMAQGHRTMVILDSDHYVDHVRKELDGYGPLVSPGCYLIVEDTHFINGPTQAIVEWLAEHPEFEVDRTRERFGATLNRGGYLRRRATA